VITNTRIITHNTAARVDAGSVASDIGIGHRACHFLRHLTSVVPRISASV